MNDVLARIEAALQGRRYSRHTQKAYRHWMTRFIRFHAPRPPEDLAAPAVTAFLGHLAVDRGLSGSAQSQALNAIAFLYREVLGVPLGPFPMRPARSRRRAPTVLSRSQIRRLLEGMEPPYDLMAELLYAGGLRLQECVELRVGDVDFDTGRILVRGRRSPNRTAELPGSLRPHLLRQRQRVAALHRSDLGEGAGWAPLPGDDPDQATDVLAGQYLFPASRVRVGPGQLGQRLHLHPSALQKALRRAARRARLEHGVSCQALRHAFAAHLVEDGVDLATLQARLGHAAAKTTRGYARWTGRDRGAPSQPPNQGPICST